jgi:hypothetical protein
MNQQISTALAELPGLPHGRNQTIRRPQPQMLRLPPPRSHLDRTQIHRVAQPHPHRRAVRSLRPRLHLPPRPRHQPLPITPPQYPLHLPTHPRAGLRTPITSHGIMLAIDRLERTIRSQLPNPAAELETTLTRETELAYVPKSAWGEHDEGNEEQDASDHQQSDPGANGGQPGRSVESAPESVPQPAHSDFLESQYTPAQVPDSKQPETPESRPSVENKMPDSHPTPEIKFTQLLHRTPYFPIRIIPDKLKPPD